jgi:hypothetical protein
VLCCLEYEANIAACFYVFMPLWLLVTVLMGHGPEEEEGKTRKVRVVCSRLRTVMSLVTPSHK